MPKTQLSDQIACVEREIAMRGRVYPGWVGKGKMKQQDADIEMALMEAVKATLTWLRDNENDVREGVKLMKSVGGGTVQVKDFDRADDHFDL